MTEQEKIAGLVELQDFRTRTWGYARKRASEMILAAVQTYPELATHLTVDWQELQRDLEASL